MSVSILTDKYYKFYRKLFLFNWIKYKTICNNLLFTFVPYDTNYCGETVKNNLFTTFSSIISTLPHIQLAYYSFNVQYIIFNKLSISHKHKLIITNGSAPISHHPANSNFDAYLMYNKSYTADNILGKIKKYKLICKNIYSSHDYTEYKTALLSPPKPPNKYSFISCHFGFIEGLTYTASYNMLLQMPLILASIGVALNNIADGGDIAIFMTVINIHIPSVRKLLTILAYAFEDCTVEQDPINQNFLYQITEYYIKCSSYRGNITASQIRELLDIGIVYADLQYSICDAMQYYDRYSIEHPDQTLFYLNNLVQDKSSTKHIHKLTKYSHKKSQKKVSLTGQLFDSASKKNRKSSHSKSHSKITQFTGDIKYLEDFELTDYAAMQADEDTQYKYLIISNTIEGIFISCFQSINNHIINSIELSPASRSRLYQIKPSIALQIKFSNMQKFVFMLEYNKIPYNKHILTIMKKERNNLIETFYSLDNTLNTTLIKYTDQDTREYLKHGYYQFKLGKPLNIVALDLQYARIDIAYQVQVNLLNAISIEKIPHIIQTANEDFTRGLKNFINMKYAAMLPTKKGVSNAFLKLWEILTIFDIIPAPSNTKSSNRPKVRVFHMCEAPGQMILSMLHYVSRKHRNIDYDWRSNSLNPFSKENQDIHGNAKVFGDDYGLIKKFPDKWLWGADNTGDVTRIVNIKWFKEYVNQWGRIDVVVGDGGLSTGLPPIMLQKLDLAQVLMVLNCCSRGGKCIVKHFTPYIKNYSETNDASGFFIGFIYLYYIAFETVSLYKPYTSNPDSGEFYVIGRNFRGNIQPEELARLGTILEKFELNSTIINMTDIPETFMLQIESFIERLTDLNVKSEEKQNMLLTCYKYGNDANVKKYLQCDRFMDENKLKSILYPRYIEWIKKFEFL